MVARLKIPNTLLLHTLLLSLLPLSATQARVCKGKMNVQSISWLHGTMQCEVKSKVARPQPSSITPDPGAVVRRDSKYNYNVVGGVWTNYPKSHEKAGLEYTIYCFRVYMYFTI
jgi:hypothetical protein